ncbi:polysaccharide biosynthesis protein [Nitrosopumilus sp.]|uniref:polysaccharide biosynthesis protein n=1 Tax=Nitrosopumilus sp. TaxID=2024843 RepID=UPI0034A0049A
MFDGKKVLITGGTGSLGTALVNKILKTDVDTIRIFSRDEWKQVQMRSKLSDKRLRFFIGDVRDKERLSRSLEDVDIVIHAAALKHVPVVEYNPFEAVKTNVYGTQNLIDSCLENNVKIALAVGTDKAVSPLNTYGATKLLMERLFVSANHYRGFHDTKFSCVRYGNVLGSRGSLVPTLVEQIRSGKKITITDPEMTRFNITMDEALGLIFRAISKGVGGEIFIPKIKAYKVGDMKDVILELLNSKTETEIISIRPGEKIHESLIIKDELKNTYENNDDYVIFDKQTQDHELLPEFQLSNLSEQYSSDKVELLSKEKLKQILTTEKLVIS